MCVVTVWCGGALSIPQVEPQRLFDSLIRTSQKLQELGFTYYNGKVAIIESGEEVSHD